MNDVQARHMADTGWAVRIAAAAERLGCTRRLAGMAWAADSGSGSGGGSSGDGGGARME